MSFINPIAFGDYSVAQLFTTTFTLKKLSATAATTTLVSVKRYTYGGTDDTVAKDISVRGAISGQVVTMADFFLASNDPKTVGAFYRVQIVARNNDATAQDEVNVIFRVPD